jgi:hypothetical protein
MFPNRVPMERDAPSPQPMVYSIIYIHQESPVKGPSYENRENIRSQSSEPHVDGRPTYNGVWPGSPRRSFTTLLSLTQCHAAFSTIPSTLAWVDQSHVSQRVSQQPSSGYTFHNRYRLPRDPGLSKVRIHITLRYGRGVGFMGGEVQLYSFFNRGVR